MKIIKQKDEILEICNCQNITGPCITCYWDFGAKNTDVYDWGGGLGCGILSYCVPYMDGCAGGSGSGDPETVCIGAGTIPTSIWSTGGEPPPLDCSNCAEEGNQWGQAT